MFFNSTDVSKIDFKLESIDGNIKHEDRGNVIVSSEINKTSKKYKIYNYKCKKCNYYSHSCINF